MNTVCTGVNPLSASPPLCPQSKTDDRTSFSFHSLSACGSSLLECLALSTGDDSKTPAATAQEPPRTLSLSHCLPLCRCPLRKQRSQANVHECFRTARLIYSSLELKDISTTSPSTDLTLLNRLRQLKIARKPPRRRRGGKRRKTAQPGGFSPSCGSEPPVSMASTSPALTRVCRLRHVSDAFHHCHMTDA